MPSVWWDPKLETTLCSQLLFHCSELTPELGCWIPKVATNAWKREWHAIPGWEGKDKNQGRSQELRQPPKAHTLRTGPPMSPKDLAAFRQSSGTSGAQDQGRGPGRSNWHPVSSRASGEHPLLPITPLTCTGGTLRVLTGRELPVYFGSPAAQRSSFSPTGRIEFPA